MLDNNTPNPNKTFQLTLTSAVGATVCANSTATVTILDNDAAMPGALSLSSASYSASEGAGVVSVTVNRTGGSNGAVTARLNTFFGSATAADFTQVATTVSFAGGDSNPKTIQVPIIDDALIEGDENFAITLDGFQTASPGPITSATGTIVDDDSATPGSAQFISASQSVSNAAQEVVVSAVRTGGTTGRVQISYQTSDGSAIGGIDYVSSQGTLTWNDGDASVKQFTVPLIVAGGVRPNSNFNVLLTNPQCLSGCGSSAFATGNPTLITIDIVDSSTRAPGTLVLSRTTAAVVEGVANAQVIGVQRIGGSGGSVSIGYQLDEGTAKFGQQLPTGVNAGTLTWADGDLSTKIIPLSTLQDANTTNEVFTVSILNQTGGAEIGTTTQAAITIIDDDATQCIPGTIRFTALNQSVRDDSGTVSLVAERVGGICGELNASFRVNAGSAGFFTDIIPASQTGALVWLDGDGSPRFIPVSIVAPVALEEDERFTVTLSGQDVEGLSQIATVTITSSVGRSKGGGGAAGLWMFGLIAGLVVQRRRKTH